MYSTRRVNKNVVEGGAYITIGDPYLSNKAPAPDRWKGKRLACPARPPPFFSPFTYTSEPVPEADPAKPPPSEATGKAAGFGFGSRAPNVRDEFALTKRTEAYRETLRQETKLHLKRGASGKGSSSSGSGGSTAKSAAEAPRSFLYDIGRGRTTAFNPKLRRDTYYALAQDQGRRIGSHRLTSHDVGQGIWVMEHVPPQFGSLSCTKAFYDASHLHVASPY